MGSNKKIRVVLVHPPLRNVITAATPEYVDKNRGHMPPMGLLYVQAAVQRSRHESIFLDANLKGWSHEEAAKQSLSYNPDLVGIQAMTFTLSDAYLVAKAVKRLNPEVKVLIGGPHATIYPKETAGLEVVDFAFAGEGEEGFTDFLEAFYNLDAMAVIPGIAFKIDGKVHYTPPAGLLRDMDSIPYPARKSSPYNEYSSVLAERNPITTMITSRGCPFQCVFCNRMGREYRCHSAQYVLDEIEEILQLGLEEIFIHDDTFTLNRQRVKAICEGIIERGYDFIWEARTRVDCVDEELIALMRRAGCHRLSFGVESGSKRVLKSIKKEIKIDQVEKVFAWCRREGIITLADFMIGNLDEEREDIDKTLDLVVKIRPDYVQYSICSPYPDTPLYKLGIERGFIPRDIWLEFAKDPLIEFRTPVWSQNFSKEELIKITARAYRKFYFHPAFVLKQVNKIHSFNHFKTMVGAALGIWKKA